MNLRERITLLRRGTETDEFGQPTDDLVEVESFRAALRTARIVRRGDEADQEFTRDFLGIIVRTRPFRTYYQAGDRIRIESYHGHESEVWEISSFVELPYTRGELLQLDLTKERLPQSAE